MTTTIANPLAEVARLADKLRATACLTSEADTIHRLSHQAEPDTQALRQALFAQCRELTAIKETHEGRSRRVIGELADQCLDFALSL